MSRMPTNEVLGVPGLQYVGDFLHRDEHDSLLASIDEMRWSTELSRRVQHYGYRYDYKSRRVDQSMAISGFPEWAEGIAALLVERRWVPEKPDQLIINEYEPGQGIASHVDCVPCFTETIVSLSLGSACVMEFISARMGKVVPVLLEVGSLVVMGGESRYEWTHGIRARKSDKIENRVIKRGRRVSLTFRKVILEAPNPS